MVRGLHTKEELLILTDNDSKICPCHALDWSVESMDDWTAIHVQLWAERNLYEKEV